jgi:hypothetical protein
MEDTYNFSWGWGGTQRNASSNRAAYEGVVRNHLARRSQQQNVTSMTDKWIEQAVLFRLQSQHVHLKKAEQKACVSFCAHSIFVMVHPLL